MSPPLHSPSPALPNAEATNFQIPATDGFLLGARLWSLQQGPNVSSVVLINAGAGIESRFYDRFAAFLAENGFPTVVYDYRGIGRSRPNSLRGFRASVEEWGSKDCAAALGWLGRRYPRAKRIVVGHSIGGFVTGFVTNSTLIDRMLLIGAHTGYWRDYAAFARPAMFLLWHLAMPAITRVVGYFPGKSLHLLEDLPKGVALEWAARREPEFWWNLRRVDGSLNRELAEELRHRFASVRGPILAVRFTDDPFATKDATDRILALYANMVAAQLVLSPSEGDGRRIGHFGFFRARYRASLWPKVLNALLDVRWCEQSPRGQA